MFVCNSLRCSRNGVCSIIPKAPGGNRLFHGCRAYHIDSRKRLSNFWTPTGGIAEANGGKVDAQSLLVCGGFLRQVYSGIFHFLPMGLRVQDKLENLIDRHMQTLGASKISLSSISSQELWKKSGRLDPSDTDAFLFKDRKGAKFLLSPTHEEEVTSLVAGIVQSYKELPVRLYQITRKYRDEPRPRQGLLRSREFLMKDLYTFDKSVEDALSTYKSVMEVYDHIFAELKIPYLVAKADSGSMGGSLSHEYHFVSPNGEDRILSCSSCDYVANEELAQSKVMEEEWRNTVIEDQQAIAHWTGLTQDQNTLVFAFYPRSHFPSKDLSEQDQNQANIHAIKRALPNISSGLEDAVSRWIASIQSPSSLKPAHQIVSLIDYRLLPTLAKSGHRLIEHLIRVHFHGLISNNVLEETSHTIITSNPTNGVPLDIVRIWPGDHCSNCDEGFLNVNKAVELGHTFYLGTRYSEKLGVMVALGKSGHVVPIQMGCHGIGVSRMIAAIADALSDDKGLNWPRVVAPFEAVVMTLKGLEKDGEGIYDLLNGANSRDDQRVFDKSHNLTEGASSPVDVILDDRNKEIGWKLKDADLIGYPVIIMLGRGWKEKRMCEVQCRRLGIKQDVYKDDLVLFVRGILEQL